MTYLFTFIALIPIAALAVHALLALISKKREFDLGCAGIALVFTLFFGFFAAMAYWTGGDADPTWVDEDRAVACIADVTDHEDLSAIVNGKRTYRFTVRVNVAGKESYQAHSTAIMDAFQMGRLGAGKTRYNCHVDREDATEVQILWSQPL
ncbi:hypothetical protein ACQEU3_43265 [Spirillospora sp. CA-253888]